MQRSEPFLNADERLDEVNEKIRLIQKRQGLTFGTDAYLLAAFLRKSPKATAVELGGGSGIVSLLAVSKGKAARVTAVEVQPEFAGLIRRNAELNGLSDRIVPLCGDIRRISAKDFSDPVDLVFSNPPYLKTGAGRSNLHPEKEVARHEICGTIFDFCDCAGRLLQTGGRFVTVWRPDRLTDLFTALRNSRLEPKRILFVHADPETEPCMILTEAIKDATASLRVLPPLFLYESAICSPRQRTAQISRIYETCSFPTYEKTNKSIKENQP